MSARDSPQRLTRLLQRQHRLDLRAEPARIDQLAQRLKPLPAAVRSERFAGDVALQLDGTEGWRQEDHPAAVAHRGDGFVAGLAAGGVQQQIDSARSGDEHLLRPVGGVVVEHLAGAEAPHIVVVARAGHTERAGAQSRRDLHGGAADASGRGGDEHGLAGLQSPPVDQTLVRGATTDHQPRRLLEARPIGHARQTFHRRERVLGKPSARGKQAREDPVARLDVGPVTGRFDDAGHFLARDERQGEPWPAAADEPDVPGTDGGAVDPYQRLSPPGRRIGPVTYLHAVDPTELLNNRCTHGLVSSHGFNCPLPPLGTPPLLGPWATDDRALPRRNEDAHVTESLHVHTVDLWTGAHSS